MKGEAKQAGGRKLTRTETVTIRLDPKLRYLVDLAARKQRRTVSSFIEWAIGEALTKVQLQEVGEETESLAIEGNDLWDVDEPHRFVKLAQSHPELLTHSEQVLWKRVQGDCHNLFIGLRFKSSTTDWKETWAAMKYAAENEHDWAVSESDAKEKWVALLRCVKRIKTTTEEDPGGEIISKADPTGDAEARLQRED